MISNAITYRFNGSARKITTPMGVSMPNGNPLEVVAIWDTGATNSVITLDVAKRLNLCSEGSTVINGVTGSQVVDSYLVTFILPNGFSKDIFATSCTAAIGCDVLIGMDIISMVDFAITSGQQGTTFSFKTPHGKDSGSKTIAYNQLKTQTNSHFTKKPTTHPTPYLRNIF